MRCPPRAVPSAPAPVSYKAGSGTQAAAGRKRTWPGRNGGGGAKEWPERRAGGRGGEKGCVLQHLSFTLHAWGAPNAKASPDGIRTANEPNFFLKKIKCPFVTSALISTK